MYEACNESGRLGFDTKQDHPKQVTPIARLRCPQHWMSDCCARYAHAGASADPSRVHDELDALNVLGQVGALGTMQA